MTETVREQLAVVIRRPTPTQALVRPDGSERCELITVPAELNSRVAPGASVMLKFDGAGRVLDWRPTLLRVQRA